MSEELSGAEFMAQLEAEFKAEGDKFYAALGRAITAWTHVEGNLYNMFLLCMGLPDEGTASVAYHSVVNFNARWEMIGATFDLRFGKTPFNDGWPALHKRTRKKAGIRNKLAHFVVASEYRGKPARKFFLIPTLNDVSNHPSVSGKPLEKIFTSDLAAMEADFMAVAKEIQYLEIRIHHDQQTGPFAISLQPTPSPRGATGAQ